jgi:hypothetical protein
VTTLPEKLTNAELRQIIDSHEKGHCMVIRTNADYRMAKELLAVREAAPYGYLREHNGQVQISIGPIRPADRASGYATPWGAVYAAPSAPALLDERHPVGGEQWGWDGEYNRGWNAYRAAMLSLSGGSNEKAEHVSQGYTLQDDTRRLDWLDEQNAKKNKSHGTTYGWGYEVNHNRIALSDCHFPAKSVRAAIDAAMLVSGVTDGKPVTGNSPVIPDCCSAKPTYAAPSVPTDQLINIANHIAGSADGLPVEWQDWASELVSDLRRLAASKVDPVVPGDAAFNAWVHGDYNRGVTLSCPVNLGIAMSAWKGCCAAMLSTVPDEIDIFVDQVCGNLPAGHQQ